MIDGFWPQLTLAVCYIGATLFVLVCHLLSPWRQSRVGVALFVFLLTGLVWWGLVGVGTWWIQGYPPELQMTQGWAFFANGLAILGLAFVYAWYLVRRIRHRRRDGSVYTAGKVPHESR